MNFHKPNSEREAFKQLKSTGSLKHLVGKEIPYHPWTGLKYPIEIDLAEMVKVMQIVNDEWVQWKMPSNRINQMNTVKNGIKQMLKEDPTVTTCSIRFKDTIRTFMEFAIFTLLGEHDFDYEPYTRNEDIMYGMINAWVRRKDWPIVCSAAVMVVKHHSFDWGKLHRVQYSNLYHQTWMRRECWKEWSIKKKDAVYPIVRPIATQNPVPDIRQFKLVKTKASEHETCAEMKKKVPFKKKAKKKNANQSKNGKPICKYFRRE